MKIFPIEAAEMSYDIEESKALREEVILLRNMFLAQNPPHFKAAIVLSHTIAWMAKIIELDKPSP